MVMLADTLFVAAYDVGHAQFGLDGSCWPVHSTGAAAGADVGCHTTRGWYDDTAVILLAWTAVKGRQYLGSTLTVARQ